MNHKILMVLAPKDFRDEEYFEPKKIFEDKGYTVVTATLNHGECYGMLGGKAKAELNLADVDVSNYSAAVFVGGEGSKIFFQNNHALALAKAAYNQGKIVAAICIAPMILANAGILSGKKATIWPGMKDDLGKSAIYTGKNLEIDGKIVTVSGPDASTRFAEAIISLL